MDRRLVLVFFTFTLSLLEEAKPSAIKGSSITVKGVTVPKSLRTIHKRQAEDFGPPDESGERPPREDGFDEGPPEGGRNRTRGPGPGHRRGGGHRRHGPGNHTQHGCHWRGERGPPRRPPSSETDEDSLVSPEKGLSVSSLVRNSDTSTGRSPHHGGRGRRFQRGGREECKSEDEHRDSEPSPPSDL